MRPNLMLWLLLGSLLEPLPTATLQGRLEVAAAETAPTEVTVHFGPAPAPGDKKLPSGKVNCPVRKGVWQCEVPAGVLDIRIKAGSWIPVYLWGIELRGSEVKDIGRVKLARGSSVVGWVETEEGTIPKDARVKLAIAETVEPTDWISKERLSAITLETRANERGFFQFEGISPGQYLLTIEHAGYALARVAPIEVRKDLEAQIVDRVILGRPVTVDLSIQPSADPYGRPWRVMLSARPPAQGNYEGMASSEGRWRSTGLAPGAYRLALIGDLGSRWLNEEIEVRSGLELMSVEVAVVEIEGRLLRGAEPLAGTLWFGGQTESRRIRFDADQEGRFHGFLPEEGSWPVQLFVELPRQRLSLEPVEIRRPRGKRAAAVEIRVPDTILTGEVVDEQGLPVTGAAVTAHHTEKVRRGEDNRVTSDADGKFEIRGLPPGAIAVQAEDGGRTSAWSQAVLIEDREILPLRLVLREQIELRGRVLSPDGVVPGAQVIGLPELGQAGISTVAEAITGPAGEFRLSIPADSQALSVVAKAPGFGRRMMKTAVDPGRPLEIIVEPASGTLLLELPPNENALLVHGGMFAPAQLLVQGASRSGSRLRIPEMEIGEYSLCAGANAISALRQGQEPPRAVCTSGFLTPHSELTLTLVAREDN